MGRDRPAAIAMVRAMTRLPPAPHGSTPGAALLACVALCLAACPSDDGGEDSNDDAATETDDEATESSDSTDTTETETETETTETETTEGETETGGLEGELICNEGSEAVSEWLRHTVADDIPGPAFVSIADFDDDGKLDLLSSAFGLIDTSMGITIPEGTLTLHLQREGLNCWERVPLVSEGDGVEFPNESEIADLDGDGDLDVVLAAGFFVCMFDPNVGDCGGLYVFENVGTEFVRHDITDADPQFFHRPGLVDLDGDGVLDIVTARETFMTSELVWYRGDLDSPTLFEAEARVIDPEVGGTIPDFADIDEDGDLDIAAGRFFGLGEGEPYVWWEQTAAPSDAVPEGEWLRHVISTDHGQAIQLRLTRDLYGDDTLRAVASNHVNQGNEPPDEWESAIIVFEPGDDLTAPWTSTIISEGIVSLPDDGVAIADAPGVFDLADADGDGDLDVFLSGDGDPRTFWLEQTETATFTTHVIEESLPQAGGGHAYDLDGDGDNDPVFTGYEDARIYVYERE